jgi:serpin B
LADVDFVTRVDSALAYAGNHCWSPLSLAQALAILSLGAEGGTAKVLTEFLGTQRPLPALLAADQLCATNASTLWLADGVLVRPDFQDKLAQLSTAHVDAAPFAQEPAAALARINSAVADVTGGYITQLLAPGTVRASTVAVLVNALFLQESWLNPFTDTTAQAFTGPGGAQQATMMHRTADAIYSEAGQWKSVQLAATGNIVVHVVLPPADVVSLDGNALTQLMADGPYRNVRLSMPRVKLRTQLSLASLAQSLGLAEVFHADADFSGISGTPIVISEVIQESLVNVDEHGILAAAATAVTMTRAMMRRESEPIEFTVDRPYWLLVRNRTANSILFCAYVDEPELF